MSQDLAHLIFEQFIEILEKLAKKSPCKFNECDFDYRVRELVGHRLIDVIFIAKDKCGRRSDVIIAIDFTSICLEDLISCKWVNYLEKLAREFLNDICPKKLVIVKDEKRKCREQPPRWEPFPCKVITTIINKKKIIKQKPECEIIIEKECECVPECVRAPCIPKKQIIIRHQTEKPKCCGDNLRLVEHKHEKFAKCRGNNDYNNHVWKKCCTKGCHCK